MGAPRHAAQLATWQPVPTVGAGVGLPLMLRCSTPSADAPSAAQLEPLAVCTTVKPCGGGVRQWGGCQGVIEQGRQAFPTLGTPTRSMNQQQQQQHKCPCACQARLCLTQCISVK